MRVAEPYDRGVQRLSLLWVSAILLSAPVSHAQSLIPASGALGPCNFMSGAIHFACVPIYIGYLIQVLLGFAGGFFLFGMMIGGYKYMFGSLTGQGTESGKKEIIARIIGFVVIVFSYILVDTLIQLLT